MKTATTVCGKCGAKIPADARQGACPACLLETGLGLLAEEVQTSNAQRPTSNAEFNLRRGRARRRYLDRDGCGSRYEAGFGHGNEVVKP
jgi:ribosomal protein L40E